jgi:hypothetical protein
MPEKEKGYCVKCKAKQNMAHAHRGKVKGKSGERPVMKGQCEVCGTQMVKFVKASL